MNLPNKITLTRIVLVLLLLIGLFTLEAIPGFSSPMIGATGINLVYLIACVVFIIASLTDLLDGKIARKRHLVTDLGKFLDPVADKLLVDSMLLFLIVPHYGVSTLSIPLWCVVIMVARDLVVDALRSIAAEKGIVLAANVFGKTKTVFQMIAIPLVLLNGWPFVYFDGNWNPAYRIATLAIYIATLASLLSGVVYLWQNRSVLQEKRS
jgi:CDP-diacylglycerol---glycerol-3-phosphate 3-phosphatidyltransferase